MLKGIGEKPHHSCLTALLTCINSDVFRRLD